MKKTVVLILTVIFLITVAGCDGEKAQTPESKTAEPETTLSASSEIESLVSSNVTSAPTSIVTSSNAETSDIETSIVNIEVSAITSDTKSQTLVTGKTFKINATVSPASATDKTITWTSSDSAVANVDKSGEVTALKKGDAVITAKSSNGKKCDISITVIEKIQVEILAYSPMDTDDSYVVIFAFSTDPGLTKEELASYITITNNTVFEYLYNPIDEKRNGLVCSLACPIDSENLVASIKEGPNGLWDKQEYRAK